MTDLARIFRLLWRSDRGAFLWGGLLSVAVLSAGLALLGLSGWFIVAAAAAGLAGTGAVFNVLLPSAGVRFLALGRTATRYGERILTHDATLRALERLRIALLQGIARKPHADLVRMRAAPTLNRILTDVDALDGLALRLVFPAAAGLLALALASLAVGALATPALAIWIFGATILPAMVVFVVVSRRSFAPSGRIAALLRAARIATIDHLRGRVQLAFAGGTARHRAPIEATFKDLAVTAHRLARLEYRSAAVLSVVLTVVATGVLILAGALVERGVISAPIAAMGFFIVLALGEVLTPFQRGITEIGKMRDAATRILPVLSARNDPAPDHVARSATDGPVLTVEGLSLTSPAGATIVEGFGLRLEHGDVVALTGRSGRGKSILLDTLAGLRPAAHGTVRLSGQDISSLAEHDIRARVGYLTQRPALVAGTIRDALRMADPDAEDEVLWSVLEAVCLRDVFTRRNGLDTLLTEAGGNLSGGEARRLALARVLLRKPDLLLLDEPTEGLDDRTAEAVSVGCRARLPRAAILLAAHRATDLRFAQRTVTI